MRVSFFRSVSDLNYMTRLGVSWLGASRHPQKLGRGVGYIRRASGGLAVGPEKGAKVAREPMTLTKRRWFAPRWRNGSQHASAQPDRTTGRSVAGAHRARPFPGRLQAAVRTSSCREFPGKPNGRSRGSYSAEGGRPDRNSERDRGPGARGERHAGWRALDAAIHRWAPWLPRGQAGDRGRNGRLGRRAAHRVAMRGDPRGAAGDRPSHRPSQSRRRGGCQFSPFDRPCDIQCLLEPVSCGCSRSRCGQLSA